MGALVSLDINAYDIGRQAWGISDRILSGTDISRINKVYAKKIDTSINPTIAHNFGVIPIGNKLIKAFAIKKEQ